MVLPERLLWLLCLSGGAWLLLAVLEGPMQSNLGSQLLGILRVLPLQLTKLRPLAQFFTNEKFRVDQIDNQLGFGLKLRKTS